ncbi:MAG: diaminopimelate epimerase [Bacteroidia bacterium]|nr:diaminopimelate epimerase [Bacteroidia bacterium]
MKLSFAKYQGTGNDFIIFDNRDLILPRENSEFYKTICHRRYGIGADGVILIQAHDDCDFEMVYFNANGREGSMCGNGARCVIAYTQSIGIIENDTVFLACDGKHSASIVDNNISIEMTNVNEVEVGDDYYILDTGSPHYVVFVDDVDQIDVRKEGSEIRYNERFGAKGTNVNFVQKANSGIRIRTYERGVEDETLSCGTGVTASALCSFLKYELNTMQLQVLTQGGNLTVSFDHRDGNFNNIYLQGPAAFVFSGEIEFQA